MSKKKTLPRLLSKSQVVFLTGYSSQNLHARIKRSTFPAPLTGDDQKSYWYRRDFEHWQKQYGLRATSPREVTVGGKVVGIVGGDL